MGRNISLKACYQYFVKEKKRETRKFLSFLLSHIHSGNFTGYNVSSSSREVCACVQITYQVVAIFPKYLWNLIMNSLCKLRFWKKLIRVLVSGIEVAYLQLLIIAVFSFFRMLVLLVSCIYLKKKSLKAEVKLFGTCKLTDPLQGPCATQITPCNWPKLQMWGIKAGSDEKRLSFTPGTCTGLRKARLKFRFLLQL